MQLSLRRLLLGSGILLRDLLRRFPMVTRVMIGRGLIGNPALVRVLKGGKKADKTAVLEKFGVQLTAEELEAISANKLSDEALDEAAGGCMCCCDECCAMGSWEA